MERPVNQAVLFTKPLHHLGLSLAPAELDARTRSFFTEHGFMITCSRQLTGADLSGRDVIREHYLMYSRAACVAMPDDLELTDKAKDIFQSEFGKSWETEAGKVFGSPALQRNKGISSHELYILWNEKFTGGSTCKLQDGVILARLEELDCYCINAFYPSMEENFYHPDTEMTYYVVEFDPAQISWKRFRSEILGATDASRAVSGSFRAELYAEYKVDFPGRDNFVHGSAGPLEGLVERTIHEPDLDMADNPVGSFLLERGMMLEQFRAWKSGRTIPQLGEIFDATEERDTADILDVVAACIVTAE